jgi:aryl-alcohol dehydrogenase-like predicted oxidoreductase
VISRVALGLGNVGGIGSAPELFGKTGESEHEALALLDAAWALGIAGFDTAASYGGGRSERALGRWLASRRHDARVTTKVYWPASGDPNDRGLAPDRIHREIVGSLARLGRDRVELYLAHEPDPTTALVDTLACFDALVRAGTIGAYGLSNVDGAQIEAALEICARERLIRPTCVQNGYSLVDRSAEREVLPLCARERIAFQAFSPLGGGWLTGKYRRGQAYPAGSRMTLRPGPYRKLERDAWWDAIEAFEAIAREREVEPAALALAWVLADGRVGAAVIGARSPAQLEPVRTALTIACERDTLAELFPR